MNRIITIAAVSVVAIAAIAAWVVDGIKRESAALANARAAAAEESRAASELKKEKAQESSALARKKAAEADAAAKEAAKEAARIEQEAEQLKLKSATETRLAREAQLKISEAQRETARLNAKAAEAASETARAEAEKAKALESAEALKAQAKADELAAEKLRCDKVVADAKLLELRKIDFETLARDLVEFQQELEERERALKPDKTSADLSWVAERDADVIGSVTNKIKRSERILPENDDTRPLASRILSRQERLSAKENEDIQCVSRHRYGQILENLWREAVDDSRILDAEFYLKSLKSLYPDWEFNPKESPKK
jgi:hypothetical protein